MIHPYPLSAAMKKVSLEFTEEEMRHLAEMMAYLLSQLSMVKSDLTDPRADTWQRLIVSILKSAHKVPAIARDMEQNPDLRHWFFTPSYLRRAFYTALMDEVRDALFWSELVGRMAEHTLEHALPPDVVETMSDEERVARTSSLENALWHEVTHHGLDRLIFMLPEGDA